jgi:cytochrome c peroxidase
MRVGFAARFNVSGSTTAGLALDLGKVLGSHVLAPDDGSESTHSAPDDALAVTLVNAIERSWFFLQVFPTPGAPDVDAARDLRAGEGAATPRAFVVPPGFPQPDLPADNPLTEEGVALGELLFNEPRLSAGNTQSCASCHREERAFSDVRATSIGADGIPGSRNAMPLFNLAWSSAYAWSGDKARIRDQVRAAIINPVEMHADLAQVKETLNRDAALRAKFAAAFGEPEISADRILLALEQYLIALVSADSKFDRAMRGAARFTEEEQRGFMLFAGEYDPARGQRGADCFHCHGGDLFTDFVFRDNGLGGGSGDEGRGAVTGREPDRGKFKTPSLRNVALTAPYMHDGRFATLEDVIAHYDHGVVRTANLDPNLAKHPDAGLQLDHADRRALVAFLRTLTDYRFQPSS